MKYLTLLSVFISITTLYGQNTPLAFGGGEIEPLDVDHQCVSESERDSIWLDLQLKRTELMEEGKLTLSPSRDVIAFQWPLRQAEGFEWNSYYGISNYVDQDLTDDGLLDYHCDTRTYDGHMGTDIFTWPFPWYMYEETLVEVIAAEEGVIIQKYDGNEDDHCECYGSWNAVYVEHSDGSIAWYGHLKTGSLTDKEIGDPVDQGEFLGVVASSGCSTGPHLHLEVYDHEGNLIDPYSGDCNAMNDTTWWETQPENREPTINTALTHDAVPEHGCPTINEDPHFQNDFYPGDVLYTAFYFHDAVTGTVGSYKLIDSEGEVWQSWGNTMDVTYNASWWWWSWELPAEGPFGVWTLEADYEGDIIEHPFNYGVYANLNENQDIAVQLYPNPGNGHAVQVAGVEDNTRINVWDVSGKMVLLTTLENHMIDLHGAEKGVYIFEILLETGPILLRYVVNG